MLPLEFCEQERSRVSLDKKGYYSISIIAVGTSLFNFWHNNLHLLCPKYPVWVGGHWYRYGTRETDSLLTRQLALLGDSRGRVEELPTVVFADSKCVQPSLINAFDLIDQVL